MSFTAKSVILDIADNQGDGTFLGLRSVDFWSGGSKIALSSSDFTAYATTEYNYEDNFIAKNVFDTSLSKTGGSTGTEWMCSDNSVTNQRVIVVFNSSQTFDEIRINNTHNSGGHTDRGAKNVVINYSTDSITDTTYDAAISNSNEVFDGQFDEHKSSDEEDEQIIELSPSWPTVTTDSADGITQTSATLNGTLDSLGNESSVDVFFEYGTDTSYGSTTAAQTLSATGSFSDSISGLTADQTYHFRAAVTDGVDTWYGVEEVLTTLEADELEGSLPGFSMDIDGSYVSNWNVLTTALPKFSFESVGGKHGSFFFPPFSMSAEANSAFIAELSGQVPVLFFEADAGGVIAVELPQPGLISHALSSTPGYLQGAFPKITMSAEGLNQRLNSLGSRMPVFQLSVNGTTGNVAVINGDFPRMALTIEATPGEVAELLGALPKISLGVSSIITGENDMDAVIAVFNFLAQSGEIDSNVLRYVKGKVR